ncbi:MAG: ATP-dependent helicase HrpB [Candidatus Binatia bacterium]
MAGPLPIDALLPEIVARLREHGRLVLSAAPGAGKTTRVPAALLDAGIAGDGTVVVLEPRRIAARAAADFVARARGEAVGETVGYRVRFEQRGGPRTRLWFVTEGVFGRQLTTTPFLDDVAVVVLDEFHERHLQGDLALAVVRALQASVRPDLRLLVMSATLETERIAAHLVGAPVVTSSGRAHPVRIEHERMPVEPRAVPVRAAAAVARLLADPGDVLVFLPGAAEIRRTAEALAPLAAARDLDVLPLHGDLPLDAQVRALRAGPRRRIVLATNVAETALTVEGVKAVVDCGLARVARVDLRHGINALRTVPISRAAADQRAGRAGRAGPGRCVRLWTAAEYAGRRAHETPEILRLDLTRTLLELRAWGLERTRALPWLDPPPSRALDRAEALLLVLGAVAADGRVTDTGRRMLALPAEPRVARMLVEAERAGLGADGALMAALASERDVLRRTLGERGGDWPPGSSDLLLRLDLIRHGALAADLDPRAVRTVERAAAQLARLVGRGSSGAPDPDALRRCVLAGFPDRVARRRAPGSPRAVLVGGTGVTLAATSVVREAELFVAVDLERTAGADAVVRVASAVDRAWLATRSEEVLAFDPARERIVRRTQTRYLDLVLDERVRTDVDRAAAGALLAEVARADPTHAAAPSAAVEHLLARLRFLAHTLPETVMPAVGALLADAVATLASTCTSFAELRAADLVGALQGMLSHAPRATLAREAPSHLQLPSGRSVPIRYEPDRPPSVSARIQELFGLHATPRLARGRVPLVVELLAPNQRPVQVTDDLASFWRTTYPEVRKQLRGRYPKHAWPDDPLTATPTSRPSRARS